MTRDKYYIAVDKEEVMRCTWCGSAESEKWIRGTNRGTYCSSTCENADGFDCGVICGIIIPAVLLFAMLSIFDTNPELIQFIVPWFAIFGLGSLIFSLRKISIINKAKAIVPKGSRDFDEVFDERYLHCEKCGAPLEVIDGAIPVKCTYCGFVSRVLYDD